MCLPDDQLYKVLTILGFFIYLPTLSYFSSRTYQLRAQIATLTYSKGYFWITLQPFLFDFPS
jgi:hypothetical protein